MKLPFITILLLIVFFSSCKKDSDGITTPPILTGCDLPPDTSFIPEDVLAFLDFPKFETLYFGSMSQCCTQYVRVSDSISDFSYYQFCNLASGNKVWQTKMGANYQIILDPPFSGPEQYLSLYINNRRPAVLQIVFKIKAWNPSVETWNYIPYTLEEGQVPDFDTLSMKDKTFYNVYKLYRYSNYDSNDYLLFNLDYGLIAIRSPYGVSYLQTDMLE